MNVRIDSSCSYNHILCRNHFRTNAYYHIRSYTVHDIWVSCFPDAYNNAILNSNICFYNSPMVHNHRIGNDQIQHVFCRSCRVLSHAITNNFSTTKYQFITINGIIFFYFNPKGSVRQTDFISCCWAVITCIFFSTYLFHFFLKSFKCKSNFYLNSALNYKRPLILPEKPYTSFVPLYSTKFTSIVAPGSNRAASPEAMSNRKPLVNALSNSKAGLTS